MTKKHHPHTRAERLALKELDEAKKQRASVRRRTIQSIKDQESEHELREVANYRNPTSDNT